MLGSGASAYLYVACDLFVSSVYWEKVVKGKWGLLQHNKVNIFFLGLYK